MKTARPTRPIFCLVGKWQRGKTGGLIDLKYPRDRSGGKTDVNVYTGGKERTTPDDDGVRRPQDQHTKKGR